ncbi:NnrS family protein [Acidovorax sp. SRB_24]|uniref:NnrS family protein n=1 Tax=Acidovorax sp. SRB_24 TaxID=1962700 RepID=UPI001EC766BB|nr:NnrS family protein [Acidovorax sp. SRB_24]NMM77769.1 short-chain dehydrogenase [Acidovorax sp. SRB_24]NMM77799.1 short-chain dehydrogenase [Acidovorax sp. SRB_24]
MSLRPATARPGAPGKPAPDGLAPPDPRWRPVYLMRAPHRLGFFLAMVLLGASGVWWALVQVDRASGLLGLPYALSPSLVHAAVMVLGFIPLFFSGFLFTAGPKWLGVAPWGTRTLLPPLLLQALGWLLWLGGAHMAARWAIAGAALAALGLAWMTALFWWLVLRSRADDQVHARAIAVACAVGSLSAMGAVLGLALDAPAVARACVLTALWGFVVVVYVTVAHRMIPFFTSSALPFIAVWRPFWVLWLMLAAAALEAAAVWVELDGPLQGPVAPLWLLVRGVLELAVGAVLLWLAGVWGVVQSLKNRLLAMLHLGFLWLGLALVLAGVSQLLGLAQGAPVLGLGALHALTMGCLASLMLAMVTRVSCGHSGRALVADRTVWSLFWALQAATVLRIAAALPGAASAWLLLAAALLWAAVVAVWGVRLGDWYGRLRADGRPG